MPCIFNVHSSGPGKERLRKYPVSPKGYRAAIAFAVNSFEEKEITLECPKGAFLILECGGGSCNAKAITADFEPKKAIAGRKKKRRRY